MPLLTSPEELEKGIMDIGRNPTSCLEAVFPSHEILRFEKKNPIPNWGEK